MIITKETDYAMRILRVLLDGEKHSVAEMSETELIPNQFAYQRVAAFFYFKFCTQEKRYFRVILVTGEIRTPPFTDSKVKS